MHGRPRRRVTLPAMLALAAAIAVTGVSGGAAAGAGSDWTSFQDGLARTGLARSETAITAQTVPGLQPGWAIRAPGAVTTQPVVSAGDVYWASWDGTVHATTVAGAPLWSAPVGTAADCQGYRTGPAATVAVATVQRRRVVVVAGGDASVRLFDAGSGQLLWRHVVATAAGSFLYSAPAVYGGNIYIGLASVSDCPLVRGRIVELRASTGRQVHVFYTAPPSCLGASIWSTPTIDTTAGLVVVTTGNAGTCGVAEPYADAVVALHTSDLTLAGAWQVPADQQVSDGDFGATSTLFTADVGGASQHLVGAADKNGLYYALPVADVGGGPLWTVALARGGPQPEQGDGSIATGAWDGTWLYAAGGATTIDGTDCAGAVRSLDPATGAVRWEVCVTAPVLGALSMVPGVLLVPSGPDLLALSAGTGATLWSEHDATAGACFVNASVSHGVVYAGNQDGWLDTFHL